MPLRTSRRKKSEAAVAVEEVPEAQEPASQPEQTESRDASPEPERPYYRLTMSYDELREKQRLDNAVDSTRAALEDLRGERDAVDAKLAELEQQAEFRAQQRDSLIAQREERAVAADVDGVATAEHILAALDRVDAAQAGIADRERSRRAELDREISGAVGAVEDAESAVAAFNAEHAGEVPRFLVNWQVREQISYMLEHTPDELDDAVNLVEAIRLAPDLLAQKVAADPAPFIEAMQAAMAPPPPPPRPTLDQARAMVRDGLRLIEEHERDEQARKDAIHYGADDRHRAEAYVAQVASAQAAGAQR